MGPSLFTMPQYVEELFGVAKQPMEKYFSYKRKNIICNYFFEDGTTFSALANTSDFAKSAAQVFGVEEQSLINYFERSKKKYNLTASLFLEKSLHKLATYFSKDVIKAVFNIASLDINTTLADYNANSFNNEKLVQFFNRFATYNGSNPYQTPGIMSMIPHLEQYYGTYFPKGGMHQITMSLFELAKDIGVEFQFNKKVQEIIVENNKATGIRLNNEIKQFNIVVSNADVVPTYRTLLPKQKAPEKMLSQPRSSSALIFYWGIEHTFPQLD
jgi:phytoene dehydrogenase-like protein